MRLAGRRALVTGASRGIGAAIARALAREGASVAVTYRANRDAADDVVAGIVRDGGRALALALAQEDRTSVRAAVAATVDALGGLDVLVNNAAILEQRPFEAIDDAAFDRVLAINLRGPFALCQEALPHLLLGGRGRIVNITSIGGQWGGNLAVHYAASKAALISLTRSLARLYSSRGLTANAIAPGLVRTDMTAAELDSPAGRAKVAAIPMGRIGTSEEVAGIAVFLASDEASYVTGQTINANGGMLFS